MRPSKTNSATQFATMAFLMLAPRLYTATATSCFVSSTPKSAIRHAAVQKIGHQWLLQRTPSALFHGKSSDEETDIHGVSRLSTLQTLLSERGAPGSRGCKLGNGDLVPVSASDASTSDEYNNLHPHLLPLAKSQSTGNIVCALRRAFADDDIYDSASLAAPWPIVESAVGLPGMRLLSLNSEHMMRRIAADADATLDGDDAQKIIGIYNDGLGSGAVAEKSLDSPYDAGSVAALGYGLDKYVLLRV